MYQFSGVVGTMAGGLLAYLAVELPMLRLVQIEEIVLAL